MLTRLKHTPVYLLLLVLMAPQPVQAAEILFRMHGSNTIGAELGPALVKAWLTHAGYAGVRYRETAPQQGLILAQRKNGGTVAVEIEAHGSSTGFRSLEADTAQIAMASRPIKSEELRALARFGAMDGPEAEHVLGLDGIAVVVHPGNPLGRLKVSQLRAIFSGEARDWKALGGKPGPIHVYARDDNSGTYDTFRSLVLRGAQLVGGARRFESNARLSDAVAQDAAGIGFVGLPYVRRSKALAVSDGPARPIIPGAFSVATEDYALTRRLFLYVPVQHANPAARTFANFALSERGQAVVEQIGFVSQKIVAGEVTLGEEAPREYAQFTKGAKRLSLNFRFRKGSIEPDNKALRDIDRLVAFMARPENDKRHLMLFGFADRHEILPIHSLDLSISRADGIADRLIRRGLHPYRVRGYGSAMPVASDETAAGRIKNRRVEVWIR